MLVIQTNKGTVPGGAENSQDLTEYNDFSEGTKINFLNIDINHRDLNTLKYSDDGIFYIHSDIEVFISIENLEKFLVNHRNSTMYYRLHSGLVFNTSTSNQVNGWADYGFFNYIKFILRSAKKCRKLKFIVSTELDNELMDMLGIPHLLIPYTHIYKLKNWNKSGVVKTLDKSNNKVMFTAAYYTKLKGILSLLYCMNEAPVYEFEWYINFPAIRSEYRKDLMNFNKLFKRLKQPDVHYIPDIIPDLSERYQICDRVIVPAFSESFSFTAREAQSYGDRVVLFDSNNLNGLNNDLVQVCSSGKFVYKLAGKSLYECLKLDKSTTEMKSNLEIIAEFLGTQCYWGI